MPLRSTAATAGSASNSTIFCIAGSNYRGTTGLRCLAGHFTAYRDGDTLASQLEFLICVHDLRRVILIAHEGCAFYTERLGVSPIDLVSKQLEDLFETTERVRGLHSELVVEAYFARRKNGNVCFERVI